MLPHLRLQSLVSPTATDCYLLFNCENRYILLTWLLAISLTPFPTFFFPFAPLCLPFPRPAILLPRDQSHCYLICRTPSLHSPTFTMTRTSYGNSNTQQYTTTEDLEYKPRPSNHHMQERTYALGRPDPRGNSILHHSSRTSSNNAQGGSSGSAGGTPRRRIPVAVCANYLSASIPLELPSSLITTNLERFFFIIHILTIVLQCVRCRKRKIRCSGEPGNGQGCDNCKNASLGLACQFLRVQSEVSGLVFDTLLTRRNPGVFLKC